MTRIHGRVPKQILLYVGRQPLHMASQFQWANGVARFTLIDMREVDGEPLLASPEPSDNVLGILARLGNHRAGLRSILEKLSRLQRDEAEFYFQAPSALGKSDPFLLTKIDPQWNSDLPLGKKESEQCHPRRRRAGLISSSTLKACKLAFSF